MERFAALIEKIDAFMVNYCKSTSLILDTAVKDLLYGGGKRLRPIMVMLAGSFGDYDERQAASYCCRYRAFAYGYMVDDDIIDEARLRSRQDNRPGEVWQ